MFCRGRPPERGRQRMPFDLDSCSPIAGAEFRSGKMLTSREHVERLRENPRFIETYESHPFTLRSVKSISGANATMARVEAASPRSPVRFPTSWRHDPHVQSRHPTRVTVIASPSGRTLQGFAAKGRLFVIGDGTDASVLQPETTVAEVLEWLRLELLPACGTSLVLEHWGSRLSLRATLGECGVAQDSKLHVLSVPNVDRARAAGGVIRRLRLSCPALRTRELSVPAGCTADGLRTLAAAEYRRGVHSWWSADGRPIRARNTQTLVALADADAVEGGTSNLAKGEELLVEPSQAAALRAGERPTREDWRTPPRTGRRIQTPPSAAERCRVLPSAAGRCVSVAELS